MFILELNRIESRMQEENHDSQHYSNASLSLSLTHTHTHTHTILGYSTRDGTGVNTFCMANAHSSPNTIMFSKGLHSKLEISDIFFPFLEFHKILMAFGLLLENVCQRCSTKCLSPILILRYPEKMKCVLLFRERERERERKREITTYGNKDETRFFRTIALDLLLQVDRK